MRLRALLLGVGMLASAGAPAPARAQTADTARIVRGRVVLIAGTDLHLELTEPAELLAGDTLLVLRAGGARGRLAVVAADSVRALLTFAGSPFAITRGQTIEAELVRGPGTAVAVSRQAPVNASLSDTVVPPMQAPPASVPMPRRQTQAAGPRASGYLMTETRWARQEGGQSTVTRTTPGASLSLRVTNLPGRSSVRIFARAEHYDAAVVAPGTSQTRVRVYSARFESYAGPVRIGLGRLTSLHDPVGGVWDGASLSVGTGLSFAVEGGFEPESATDRPSSRVPRVSVSAEAHGRGEGFRYRSAVSALRYLRDAPSGRAPLALSTRHSFTAGPFSVWGDALVEGSDGAFSLRWGGAHAAVQVSGGARVHAGYRRYRPFRTGAVDTAATLTGRGRIDGGIHVPFGRASLSVNGAMSPGSAQRSQGGSARLYVSRITGGLDIDLLAGMWEYGTTRTLDAGGGLGISAGRLFARAGYRLERGSARQAETVHEIEGDATVMIGRRSSINAIARHSLAGAASGTRLEARLTWGF